jgi:MFS family permease
MTAAVIPLMFLVGETDRRREPSRRMSLRQLIRDVPAADLRVLGMLLVIQAIANVANFTNAQFLGLKLIEAEPGNPSFYTGLAFSAAGGFTAIGALTYSRFVARFGYRIVAAAATALFGVGVAGIALSNNPVEIVISSAAMGAVFGACIPALNSMIGLECPEPLRATIYGTGNSLVGILLAIVPLLAGLVAVSFGVSIALFGVAVGAMLCGATLFVVGREPKVASGAH